MSLLQLNLRFSFSVSDPEIETGEAGRESHRNAHPSEQSVTQGLMTPLFNCHASQSLVTTQQPRHDITFSGYHYYPDAVIVEPRAVLSPRALAAASTTVPAAAPPSNTSGCGFRYELSACFAPATFSRTETMPVAPAPLLLASEADDEQWPPLADAAGDDAAVPGAVPAPALEGWRCRCWTSSCLRSSRARKHTLSAMRTLPLTLATVCFVHLSIRIMTASDHDKRSRKMTNREA